MNFNVAYRTYHVSQPPGENVVKVLDLLSHQHFFAGNDVTTFFPPYETGTLVLNVS